MPLLAEKFADRDANIYQHQPFMDAQNKDRTSRARAGEETR